MAQLGELWSSVAAKLDPIDAALARLDEAGSAAGAQLDEALRVGLGRLARDNARYVEGLPATRGESGGAWRGAASSVDDPGVALASWTRLGAGVYEARVAVGAAPPLVSRGTLFLRRTGRGSDRVDGPFGYASAATPPRLTLYGEALDEALGEAPGAAFRVSVLLPKRQRLYPLQWEGVRWMLLRGALGLGGILADEMGLGKTIMLVGCIAAMHAIGRRKVLLVVPTATASEMERTIRSWYPSARLTVYANGNGKKNGNGNGNGAKKKKKKKNGNGNGGNGAPPAWQAPGDEVHLTTYPYFRDHAVGASWKAADALLLDEAHRLFTRGSNIFRHAMVVGSEATSAAADRLCFLATATPLGNQPEDLFTLLEACAPRVFFEATRMVKEADPAANGGGSNGPSLTGGGATIKNIEGENLRRFRAVLEGDGGALASVVRRMLGTFMLQRTTEGALRVDALRNLKRPLPSRTHVEVEYNLTDAQLAKVRELRRADDDGANDALDDAADDALDDEGPGAPSAQQQGTSVVFEVANQLEMARVDEGLRERVPDRKNEPLPAAYLSSVATRVLGEAPTGAPSLLRRVVDIARYERARPRTGRGKGGLVIVANLLRILDLVQHVLERALPAGPNGARRLFHARIDGTLSKAQRERITQGFQSDPEWKIICVGPAGQEGINLFSADAAISITDAYNPERTRQAFGRVYRNGQWRPVRTYALANTAAQRELVDLKGKLLANKRAYAKLLDVGREPPVAARVALGDDIDALDAIPEESAQRPSPLPPKGAASLALSPAASRAVEAMRAPHPLQARYDGALEARATVLATLEALHATLDALRAYRAGVPPSRGIRHAGTRAALSARIREARRLVDVALDGLQDVAGVLPVEVRAPVASPAAAEDGFEARAARVGEARRAAEQADLLDRLTEAEEAARARASARRPVSPPAPLRAVRRANVFAAFGLSDGDAAGLWGSRTPAFSDADDADVLQPGDERLFRSAAEIEKARAEARSDEAARDRGARRSARFSAWIAPYLARIRAAMNDEADATFHANNRARREVLTAWFESQRAAHAWEDARYDYVERELDTLAHPTGDATVVVQSDPLWTVKAELLAEASALRLTFRVSNQLNSEDWSTGPPKSFKGGAYRLLVDGAFQTAVAVTFEAMTGFTLAFRVVGARAALESLLASLQSSPASWVRVERAEEKEEEEEEKEKEKEPQERQEAPAASAEQTLVRWLDALTARATGRASTDIYTSWTNANASTRQKEEWRAMSKLAVEVLDSKDAPTDPRLTEFWKRRDETVYRAGPRAGEYDVMGLLVEVALLDTLQGFMRFQKDKMQEHATFEAPDVLGNRVMAAFGEPDASA